MLCRVFGKCLHGDILDREIGDLIDKRGPALPKLFTYVRYNAPLTSEWLDENGLGHIAPRHVQALDSTRYMRELQQVGARVAEQVQASHFSGF
jgi:hypothetical protein